MSDTSCTFLEAAPVSLCGSPSAERLKPRLEVQKARRRGLCYTSAGPSVGEPKATEHRRCEEKATERGAQRRPTFCCISSDLSRRTEASAAGAEAGGNRSSVWLLLAFFFTVGVVPADALLAQTPDTTEISTAPLFTPRDALFAGGFLLGTVVLAPLDVQIAEEVQRAGTQANRALRDTAAGFRVLGVPGSALIAGSLYAAGRLAEQPRLADLGLHTTEAIVLGESLNYLVKGVVGRARPYMDADEPLQLGLGRGFGNDDYRSFPSGHTVAAFATAAAVSTELRRIYPSTKWWVAPILYGGATLVGVSRVYNNKHWASDVAMGAALGSFSGWKVVGYNHSHPGNRIDGWLLSARVLPDGTGGSFLVWSVPVR